MLAFPVGYALKSFGSTFRTRCESRTRGSPTRGVPSSAFMSEGAKYGPTGLPLAESLTDLQNSSVKNRYSDCKRTAALYLDGYSENHYVSYLETRHGGELEPR